MSSLFAVRQVTCRRVRAAAIFSLLEADVFDCSAQGHLTEWDRASALTVPDAIQAWNSDLERENGLEPSTLCLGSKCSTNGATLARLDHGTGCGRRAGWAKACSRAWDGYWEITIAGGGSRERTSSSDIRPVLGHPRQYETSPADPEPLDILPRRQEL